MPLYGFYNERQRDLQGHVLIATAPGSKEPIQLTQICDAEGIDQIPQAWHSNFVCEVEIYIGIFITDPEVFALMQKGMLKPGEIPEEGGPTHLAALEGMNRMATLDTLLKKGIKPRRAVLAAMGTPKDAN